MSDLNLDRLREVAGKVPRDYWEITDADDPHDVTVSLSQEHVIYLGGCPDCGVRAGFEEAEADYITEFAPPVIFKLLDRLEAAEAKVERVVDWLVTEVHYPFDSSWPSSPPPIDHRLIAARWNEWDDWQVDPAAALECVLDEAGDLAALDGDPNE